MTAQRRFRQGLTFGLAYTWSKVLGTASDNEGNFINIVCSRCYDYCVLNFDRRQVLVVNYLYDLPKLRSDNWLVLTFNIAGNFSDYRANQQGSITSLRNLRGGANSPAVGPLGRATPEFNAQPGYVSGSRVIQLAAKIYF